MADRITLTAHRQPDLHSGHPDYHVYAGEQRVGRIYQSHFSGEDAWVWAINGVTFDMSVGATMSGYCPSFEMARSGIRFAFGAWLVWARAIPSDDPKHPWIATQLRKMAAP